MSCPFRHLWPSGQPSPHGGGSSGADVAAETEAAPAAQALAAAESPEQQQQQQQGSPPSADKCPFLAGVGGISVSPAADAAERSPGGAAPEPATPAGAAPAVCPLGFGSGARQPALGEFHCLVCRGLFHECVAAQPCGHRYCAGCIAGARDCPQCGSDVEALAAQPEAQAAVDRYIEAHAGTHSIWDLEGGGGEQAPEGMAGERSRASFLLQLGLRALGAGNVASARHRFTLCQADLQQQVEEAQAQLQESGSGNEAASSRDDAAALAALRCRLGAISGCLGDCARAEGDAPGTLRHYEHSVQLLQAAGDDPEAQQALSVALNKRGELLHLQGDLGGAADQYAAALALRRTLLAATRLEAEQTAASGGGSSEEQQQPAAEAGCSAGLDLAASCLKLSGARRGLGGDAEAAALLGEACELLGEQESGLPRMPARLQRKHTSLAGFAAAMRAAAAAAPEGQA